MRKKATFLPAQPAARQDAALSQARPQRAEQAEVEVQVKLRRLLPSQPWPEPEPFRKPAGFVDSLLTGGETMAQFTVNTHRFDPYKNFKFRVKWDGRYVAGVSKVGSLKRSTEVVEHREGGDPSSSRKSPGRTKYEAITLERGVTHDTAFEQWANKVWNFGSGLGAEVSLKDFRKDIIIELYNEAGQLAIAYKVFRCWVSEFQAQPDLDANANAVAIQTLKLENEGWERDYEVVEPAEPSFTEP
jgi:phage tail-like protein